MRLYARSVCAEARIKMATKTSELAVITKAKDLCSYIMTVTEKSLKRFRFTLVSRMQNLALDTIEQMYRANVLGAWIASDRKRNSSKGISGESR